MATQVQPPRMQKHFQQQVIDDVRMRADEAGHRFAQLATVTP